MAYQTVVEASLRKNIYNTIFTLIDANKLTGWTVLSAFPEVQATFPCLVIKSANITLNKIGFTTDGRINEAEIVIELYSKASSRKETIDLMRDKLYDIFLTNKSTLFTYNLFLSGENPFIDSGTDEIEYNNEKFNTSAVAIQLGIR